MRFMRIIVFFDLTTETGEDRRNYRKFRKALVNNGFIMLQESVYCRMISSPSVETSVKKMIKDNKPPKGLVQFLSVTEKQFAKMEYVVGEHSSEVIDNSDKVVIL